MTTPSADKTRLWRDILNRLAARTPDMYAAQFNREVGAFLDDVIEGGKKLK